MLDGIWTSEAFDFGADVVIDIRPFGGEETAVEAEVKTLARKAVARDEFAHVEVIAGAYGHISQMQTCGSRCIGNHVHLEIVGQIEVIDIRPALGLKLDIELISRPDNICRVVAVEKFVSPTIDTHTKSWKPSPLGDRVECKRHSSGGLCDREQCDY